MNYDRARSTQAQSGLLAALEQVVATVTTMQSSQRGYVLSGSDAFLDPYRKAKAEFDHDLGAFQEAAGQAKVDPSRTKAVVDIAKREIAFAERVVALRRTSGYEVAAATVVEGEGKRILDELRAAFREQKREASSRAMPKRKPF